MIRRSLTLALPLILGSTVVFADPVRVTPKGLTYPNPEDGRTGLEVERRQRPDLVTIDASVPTAGPVVVDTAVDRAISNGNVSVSVPALTPPDVPGLGLGLAIAPPFVGELPVVPNLVPAAVDIPLLVPANLGQGLASIGFSNPAPIGGGFSDDFSNAAPNPEPGSLLLFGTGAAWLGSRWRKRRQQSRA